jgi:hypothetical protein
MECFTHRLQAERFCGNSYSRVTSVTCLCNIMQALGLIISHSFVAGVRAHDIGDSWGCSVCVFVRGCRTGKMSRSECSGNVKAEPKTQ